MIDCEKSISMLSDFRDGVLDEDNHLFVRMHLDCCPPCHGIFRDLELLIITATELRISPAINFPDEEIIWRRISIEKRTIQ